VVDLGVMVPVGKVETARAEQADAIALRAHHAVADEMVARRQRKWSGRI